MTDSRTPGWYADPSGDRERLRWWDGSAWTAIGRDRLEHEVAPPRPDVSWSGGELLDSGGDRAGGAAGGELLDPDSRRFGPDPRPPRPRTAWIAVLLAGGLIAALVLTGAFPGGQRRGDTTEPAPPTQLAPTVDPPYLPLPTERTPFPVSGPIVDRDAGLRYDLLPGEWRAWDLFTFEGFLSSVGYYRVVQEETPGGGQYWANVTSGLVAPGAGGRADLATTARRLVDGLGRYYPKHSPHRLLRRATAVDGRPGYLISYLAVFDKAAAAGYTAKSEQVAVLVVDTGRPLPSALYVSLPDTARTTWPLLDHLLASVHVVR